MTHEIAHRGPARGYSGYHFALCSCGWRHQETSRQNAWARAAKMRAAVNRHFKDVDEKGQGL